MLRQFSTHKFVIPLRGCLITLLLGSRSGVSKQRTSASSLHTGGNSSGSTPQKVRADIRDHSHLMSEPAFFRGVVLRFSKNGRTFLFEGGGGKKSQIRSVWRTLIVNDVGAYAHVRVVCVYGLTRTFVHAYVHVYMQHACRCLPVYTRAYKCMYPCCVRARVHTYVRV